MVELQSEDNEKKTEVFGKAGNNKEHTTKEQTENKNMILKKDENIENTKSEGQPKGEDEQYGKPNQQWQKNKKLIADETKTKEKEKENQGDKTSSGEEEKNNKNTSKTNELETRHLQITSGKTKRKKIRKK